MVDFFTDEIKTYLVGNNEPIACTTSHYLLANKVRERLELFKKLKRAVEELAIEIPNHAEMFTFVVLKKEINMFDQTLTEKSNVLKSINEGLINFRYFAVCMLSSLAKYFLVSDKPTTLINA